MKVAIIGLCHAVSGDAITRLLSSDCKILVVDDMRNVDFLSPGGSIPELFKDAFKEDGFKISAPVLNEDKQRLLEIIKKLSGNKDMALGDAIIEHMKEYPEPMNKITMGTRDAEEYRTDTFRKVKDWETPSFMQSKNRSKRGRRK